VFNRILVAISLLSMPGIAFAQASPTASRRGDLQIGGGLSNANTDYLPTRANGGTAYVDFDFYHNFGIEGEFSLIKDDAYNFSEKTFEVGARYSRVYRDRFVPHGKVMYGRGVFNYAPNQTANATYNLFSAGAGVDYRVLSRLNVRAEFEYQKWLSFPPNGLGPAIITIGAAYHFPVGKLSGFW
jgi:opacity protein-like surface antigen